MKNLILNTNDNWSAFIVRITLGSILFPHGAQKLIGWFGGYGFTGTMNFFTETMGLPWIIGFLVIVLEFFGAIAIVIGFAGRIWSSGILLLMLGIIASSHLSNGFFMNWFGNQAGEGFEYHLLIIGMAVSLIVSGSGAYSVDKIISSQSHQP